MKNKGLWELVTGVIIIAIIFMLVRPGSPAGTAVTDLSEALAALVGTATGYTSSSGTTGGTQTT
jgi:hypothetical protein